MRVNQVAKELGITVDTVRYYTREGLLQPQTNRKNGYKEYTEKERRRLRFIVSARQLGFSVKDISQIIAMADTGKAACPLVRRLIEQRLQETEQRFQDIGLLRQRMLAASKEWSKKPDRAPTGTMICHLIEEFVH